MESFMGGAMLVEAAVLSFLLALWMTWLGLRGLFVLMPATSRAVQPVRFAGKSREGNRRHAP